MGGGYESMAFDGESGDQVGSQENYETEDEARVGHADMCAEWASML